MWSFQKLDSCLEKYTHTQDINALSFRNAALQ